MDSGPSLFDSLWRRICNGQRTVSLQFSMGVDLQWTVHSLSSILYGGIFAMDSALLTFNAIWPANCIV